MVMSENAIVEAMMVAARIQRSRLRELGAGLGVLFMLRQHNGPHLPATVKLRHPDVIFGNGGWEAEACLRILAPMDPVDLPRDDIIRAAKEMDFSGAVSVAPLGAGPSLDLAFGFAERGHRVPNTVETRFGMGSGCKGFTAVAVGLLIDEGRIGLDTRLADCVPGFDFKFAPVTIGQLLNHTSGVPDYFDEDFETDYAALWRERPSYHMTDPADFLPLFENLPMKAKPGSGFHYCNAGYVLLGLAIESLVDEDFRDFIADRIFDACGMTRSGYFALDALPENTATGYVRGLDGWRSNIFAVPVIGGGDGGAYTTVGDMRRFWTALLEGRLLKPETVARFTAPSANVPERPATDYGYGFWLRERQGRRIVAVEGADPGATMESQVTLHNGIITTVLSNIDDGAEPMFRLLDRVTESG
jgi:CubicO group peptidase (beta-lactamase class C family)